MIMFENLLHVTHPFMCQTLKCKYNTMYTVLQNLYLHGFFCLFVFK